MKRQTALIAAIIATFLLGGLAGGGILSASSPPKEPVQGKGQIITFVEDAVVPTGSQGATNIRSQMIPLATYKNLSFMVAYSPGAHEWPFDINWTNEGYIPGLEIGFVFIDGSEETTESWLSLPVGFWGIPVGHPGAQIAVPAPYGRVEITNTTGQDLTITIKAYATQ